MKVALAGYPGEYTQDEILQQARYYGVAEQIEMYERLSPEEVNLLYNRAKVNLLWSRKEGFNRAIIEGMLAGVPCIIRDQFNYGYHYSYINPQTGCFVGSGPLPERLSWFVANHEQLAHLEIG